MRYLLLFEHQKSDVIIDCLFVAMLPHVLNQSCLISLADWCQMRLITSQSRSSQYCTVQHHHVPWEPTPGQLCKGDKFFCFKILTQTSLNLVWWLLPASSWGVGSFQSAGVNSGQANRTCFAGAFSRLIDAFSSRSWECLQLWQLNTRSDSFISWTWPHLEHVFELGNHWSTNSTFVP